MPILWLVVAGLVVGLLLMGCTTCEDLQQEAREARDAAASCSTSDECVLFTHSSCLGVSSCGTGVRADARDDLRLTFRELSEEYAEGCDACSQPFCPVVTHAECIAGMCTAR